MRFCVSSFSMSLISSEVSEKKAISEPELNAEKSRAIKAATKAITTPMVRGWNVKYEVATLATSQSGIKICENGSGSKIYKF